MKLLAGVFIGVFALVIFIGMWAGATRDQECDEAGFTRAQCEYLARH